MMQLAAAFSLVASVVSADESATQSSGTSYQAIMMMVVMGVFFYFILLRPEQKRRKKMKEMRAHLSVGDDVVAMGILGTVDQIDDATVILKMVDGAKIKVLKEAVTSSALHTANKK
ncbi:preprotein translocase subunit YajC [Candidatus Aerophobetes bacterium]|uniref:Preprotein translocase subunit YajC n=1 Tax=Aerophobetes bacterium TaxID=2030807 RepID=A0A2A4WXD1_UNCAE|nr:MAG: preprotein translocase subunit YajC [Candidatus Aerophobetes bacterium]